MTDYERIVKTLLADPEKIREFKSADPKIWPKRMAFLALALIAIFVFLMLQGCAAPLVKIGETCTSMTSKGVLLSKPCPQQSSK